MKLENAIEQYEFPTEQQKLLINLIYTHNWSINKIKAFLSDFDLTVQQFNILRIVRGQRPNPTNMNLLRSRMLDKMSDTSRVVDRLRNKGLLERCKSKSDRRSVDITITEKGLQVLAQVDQHSDFLNNLFGNLSTEQAKIMNDYLDQIREGQE